MTTIHFVILENEMKMYFYGGEEWLLRDGDLFSTTGSTVLNKKL